MSASATPEVSSIQNLMTVKKRSGLSSEFLEAAPSLSSNALLLCAYGNPTIFAHPVEKGGSRKKLYLSRNAFDWLGSENTRSKTAHLGCAHETENKAR